MSLQVLLIKRKKDPFKGQWCLPGGFLEENESLEAAAIRELQEETGVEDVFLEQLYTFGEIDRDPRARVVSVSYYSLINLAKHNVSAGSDADDAQWHSIDAIPSLGFDHVKVLEVALSRLQAKVRYEPIIFNLLPEKFTISQLQQLYEVILCESLDRRNFRRKIQSLKILTKLSEKQEAVAHRAADFYSFDQGRYDILSKRKGFMFEV